MPGRKEDGNGNEAGFADLVGETRPLKGSAEKRVAPPRTRATRRRPEDPKIDSGGSDSGSFRFPDADEPRLGGRNGVSDRQLRALARGQPAPEERIDLHGVRALGGDRLLSARLESSQRRGLRCVVVIHGRGKHSETGEAVLRDQLPGWLTQAPAAKYVLGFAPAPAEHGGSGATLVLIRRPG